MGSHIQNADALASSDLRRDALAIAEAGYEAIDVGAALKRTLRVEEGALQIGSTRYPLAGRRVVFVGVGKCAFAAAVSVEEIFGEQLTGGIVLDVADTIPHTLTKIEKFVGTHPLPSEQNVQATTRILEVLTGCTTEDLVIALISGGGSTLLCLPEAPMTCFDETVLFRELTGRGATIQEINTVRKHTSRARGGGLAAAAYPAEVISLIVSDVPGNDIQYIASGPTVLDTSTVQDAKAVLARYPSAAGATIQLHETPKDVKIFDRVVNVLFLTSQTALAAMEAEAVARGYRVSIENDHFSGEAQDIGRSVAEKLHRSEPKTVFLYAGESTVTLKSEYGAGGRNQELVLAALESLRDDEVLVSFASDGHDNTNHAGALGDSSGRERALAQGLSVRAYLAAHRSYDFFSTSGDALVTGYTGSNVSDLIIALKK